MNNDELTNQLNMIDTAIKMAESENYRPVWENQQPMAFGTKLAALKTALSDTLKLASRAYSTTTGPAEDKDVAETALEDLAYSTARALASYYKSRNDLTNRAKVNVRKSAIVRLRDQALTTRCTEIKNLANAAVTADATGAVEYALDAARVTALSTAIGRFEQLRNTPRTAVSDRSALRRQLRTDAADLMDSIADLDDLALQYDKTEAGRLFIAAWKNARIIVDAGHGKREEEPQNPPGGNPPTP